MSKKTIQGQIESLKAKQSQWMKEHEKQKSSGVKQVDRKKESPVPWTSGANYNGFVVRKETPKASSSRPTSAVSTKSSKHVHSSLRTAKTAPIEYVSKKSPVKTTTPKKKTPKKTFTHSSLKNNEKPINKTPEQHRRVNNNGIADRHETDVAEYILNKTSGSESSSSQQRSPLKSQRSPVASLFTLSYDDNENELYVQRKSPTATTKSSNHLCVSCRVLMADESHAPYVVVPCGDSLCLSCLTGRDTCPTCSGEIDGIERNSVLAGIIERVQREKEHAKMERKESETRKYVKEYQELSAQVNKYQDEATRLIGDMEQTTTQLLDEQQQKSQIERKAADIKKQIRSLTSQLKSLEREHGESTETCAQLESTYESHKQELIVCEKTLSQLKNSQDKVQFLVESLCPNLKLS